MNFVSRTIEDGIARVVLQRGKVNALSEAMIQELSGTFAELAADPAVRAVVITGTGKFFSFGFDIPEFVTYPKEAFIRYLALFTGFYRELFVHPKPVVAALNGHTIAGACMIASACDARVMVTGKARISLNEIQFGSSLFAGSVDMLRFAVGDRNAQAIAYGGRMYSAEEAQALGLVDLVVPDAEMESEAMALARDYAQKDPEAFRSIKWLLRKPVAWRMEQRERGSIEEFVRIWYSEATWTKLQEKKIHS